jgi:Tektin family
VRLIFFRISLVQEWLRNLQHSLQATEKEKLVLVEVKTYLEAYLNEALLPPLDVVAQCLYLRDQRHPKELTIDPVTAQLKDVILKLYVTRVKNPDVFVLVEKWRI